ncbi:TPR-like protein [Atractiella rhizophila]|nr:TPR-like protein [Atractiella rhizophila]
MTLYISPVKGSLCICVICGAGSGSGSGKPQTKKAGRKRKSDSPASVVEGEETEEQKKEKKEKAELQLLLEMSENEIKALSQQDRHLRALKLKTAGNRFYSARSYQTALNYYSKAIEFERAAVYYSNRAACCTNLGDTEAVIRDCTSALELDNTYVKALNRRASAREAMGDLDSLFEALCDYTIAAILGEFKDEQTAQKVDAAVKRLAGDKAKDVLKTRALNLPSVNFVRAYLEAFRPNPFPPLPATPSQGDETLELAFGAVKAADYTHAFTLLGEALEQGIDDQERLGLAQCWRGTFFFILGDAKSAQEHIDIASSILDKVVDGPEDSEETRKRRRKNRVQTWIKKASVHMELGETMSALRDFDEAEKIDSEDADVYYHRGQVYFIMQDFDNAMGQYEKSILYDPAFIFSHIQLAVALYKGKRKGMLPPQPIQLNYISSLYRHNYYGEVLLDQGNFPEAVSHFQKAYELEEQRPPPINVIPLINQAMCLIQSENNLTKAEELCQKALKLDPQCDIAINTLAQVLLQQNRIDEAGRTFERAAERARTEGELVQTWCFVYASRAQKRFIENYPAVSFSL